MLAKFVDIPIELVEDVLKGLFVQDIINLGQVSVTVVSTCLETHVHLSLFPDMSLFQTDRHWEQIRLPELV